MAAEREQYSGRAVHAWMVALTFVVALPAFRFTIFLAVAEDNIHVLSNGSNHRKMVLKRRIAEHYVKALNVLSTLSNAIKVPTRVRLSCIVTLIR